ncbi:hypothetical protein ACIP79_02240 [Streptomyces sp. NPDC088747]|uniref:hypothetical protein n=1 Tax=Streptomyces sp. NPDC088747 TaxID=3365886 RepID=UPI003800FB44
MKFRRASLAASITFATAITLFNSSSAYAGTDAFASNGGINTYGAGAGQASFASYGDEYYVYDNIADGHGVELRIWDYDSIRTKVCNASAGNYCVYNYNLPEGSDVEIQVCLTEKSVTISGSCGYSTKGKA